MFQVEANKPRNLLKLTFSQNVGPEEASQCAGQLRTYLAELGSGFRLLTDLSGLTTMDVGCAPYLDEMMDMCNEKGVETIVRIVPDAHKDIGFNILSLFHYRPDIRIVTCQTLTEAAELL